MKDYNKKSLSQSILALTLSGIVFMSGLFCSTQTAKADTIVQITVAGIRVLQPSSTLYATYHGYIASSANNYFFGGSHCASISEPSETELAMLSEAVIGGQIVTLHYITSSASQRCVVGFYVQ